MALNDRIYHLRYIFIHLILCPPPPDLFSIEIDTPLSI